MSLIKSILLISPFCFLSLSVLAESQDTAKTKEPCREVSVFGFTIREHEGKDKDGEAPKDEKPLMRHSQSLSEGLARGSLKPFLELTARQAEPKGDTLRMRGLRLGLSEFGERELALAYLWQPDWAKTEDGQSYRLRLGGFSFGGMPDVDSLTEGFGRLFIGTGEAEVSLGEIRRKSRLLFVVEPEIGLGLNITPWLQTSLSVSYLYINGLQVLGLSGRDLRVWSANANLLLHSF